MNFILRLLVIFLLLSLSPNLYSQQKNLKAEPDSVLVKKGSRVTHGNISFIPENDTIICVSDTVFFRVRYGPEMRSRIFYDSLEVKAERSRFIKSLYDLTFVSSERKRKDTVITIKSEVPFLDYEGKIIRNIRIKRLDVFGPELYDTTLVESTSVAKILNAIHINSREWVIKQNLRIKKGDIVDPLILAENERILRELPYIRDALISVSETNSKSDSVDILVITKDVWSINVVPIIKSSTSATLRIYDANILGFGHKLSNKIGIDTRESPLLRYKRFGYEIENILGSFFRGSIEYTNDTKEKSYDIKSSRPFIPPLVTVGLGGGIKRINRNVNYVINDTVNEKGKLKYDTYYIWAGKTFPLNFHHIKGENRTYFTISGNYSKYFYLESKDYSDDNKYKYENRDLLLGSLSISRNNYYLSNLIYSFGITEDIPYGYNFTYTFGEKFGQYNDMFYSAIKFSYGHFTPAGRYFNAKAEYGGYIRNKFIQQGVFSLQTNYASKLSDFIGSQLRNFISIKYLKGINRYDYEKIYLDDKHGLRGVGQVEELSGLSRFSVNMESVLFTPFYFLGFRFAAFGYLDNGFIGYENNILNSSNYYLGMGLGLRIRNENLIFKTFQIELSLYPISPENINDFDFSIKSVDNVPASSFNPTAPGIVKFE